MDVPQLGHLSHRHEVPTNPVETIATDTSQQRIQGLRCVLLRVVVAVRDLVFQLVKHVLVHHQDSTRVRSLREVNVDVVLLNPTPSCARTGWNEIITKRNTSQGERIVNVGDGSTDEVLPELEACLRADELVAHVPIKVGMLTAPA